MPKPPDRVQVLKQEEASDGGDPLDDEMGFPVPIDSTEDAVQAAGMYVGESGQAASDEAVGLYRESDKLILFDTETPAGVDLTTIQAGLGGITEGAHELLDTLTHNIAENSFLEVVRSGNDVTDVIYWTNSGKTEKIRETNITRSVGKVSQVVIKQYASGVLQDTLTGVIVRSGGKVADITWTKT